IRFRQKEEQHAFKRTDAQSFTFERAFNEPDSYEISLRNGNSANRDKIAYRIDVVKDQYPEITVNNFRDSILYQRIILGGMIGDDHGVTKLALTFKVRGEKGEEVTSRSVNIPITAGQLRQSFFYNWSVDSLKLKPGQQLEYFLTVWD